MPFSDFLQYLMTEKREGSNPSLNGLTRNRVPNITPGAGQIKRQSSLTSILVHFPIYFKISGQISKNSGNNIKSQFQFAN